MKTTIDVIYWDLGGVCVTDNVEPVFEEYGVGYGKQQQEAWKKLRVGNITSRDFFQEALAGSGLEGKLEEVRQRAKNMIKVKLDGALPIIQRIHELGLPRQGILSNHSIEWGSYILEELGVGNYVDPKLKIISEQVRLAKPEPPIFEYARLLAGGVLPEEILFFDNQQRNVDAARKVGWQSELFSTGEKAKQQLRQYGIQL